MRETPSDVFPQISEEAIGGLWKQIVERNCGKFHDTCLFHAIWGSMMVYNF